MNKNESILLSIAKEGLPYLQEQGYQWLKKQLYPAIEQAKNRGHNHLVLAEVYCVIGDLHDLNNAPQTAMQAYRTAIHFDPNCATAYREIAAMSAQVGAYFDAFQYINLAIEKAPNDPELVIEKQEYQDDMNYDVEPLYTQQNERWKLCELLAAEQFEMLIQQVLTSESTDIYDLKCLNQAYGALEKIELYRQTWAKLTQSATKVEMDYADWFYMPRALYQSEKMTAWRAASSLWDDEN